MGGNLAFQSAFEACFEADDAQIERWNTIGDDQDASFDRARVLRGG